MQSTPVKTGALRTSHTVLPMCRSPRSRKKPAAFLRVNSLQLGRMSMGLPVTLAELHTMGAPVCVQRSLVRRRVLTALLLWWLLHLGALFYTGADVTNTLQATEDGSWLNQFPISLLG